MQHTRAPGCVDVKKRRRLRRRRRRSRKTAVCGVRETKEERRRGVIEFPLYSPARSAAHGTINGRNGDKKTQQKKHDAPVIEKKRNAV